MKYSFNWSTVSAGAPYVTLSSIGIAFNSVAVENLGNPEEIMIGFDDQAMALGIKPYDGEENVQKFSFSSRVKNGWVRIGCRDFIKYLTILTGVDYSKAKKYIAQKDEESGFLIVKLKQGTDKKNVNGVD